MNADIKLDLNQKMNVFLYTYNLEIIFGIIIIVKTAIKCNESFDFC